MGGEFGQWREWSEARELDWALLRDPRHQGVQALVRDLNRLHRAVPALHAGDRRAEGFQWIDPDDEMRSVLTWIRQDGDSLVAVLCNLTPVPRPDTRIGLPRTGRWREVLNTDSKVSGGSRSRHGESWRRCRCPLSACPRRPASCCRRWPRST
ncbi:alpha amylase C-terminal domain-containing protein [Paeniroseomonas aquatica]